MKYRLKFTTINTGRIQNATINGKQKRYLTRWGAQREVNKINNSTLAAIYNVEIVPC